MLLARTVPWKVATFGRGNILVHCLVARNYCMRLSGQRFRIFGGYTSALGVQPWDSSPSTVWFGPGQDDAAVLVGII